MADSLTVAAGPGQQRSLMTGKYDRPGKRRSSSKRSSINGLAPLLMSFYGLTLTVNEFMVIAKFSKLNMLALTRHS